MNSEKGIKQASTLLRHSNLSTTADIYVYPSEEETRGNMEVLDGKLFEFCPTGAPLEALGSEIVH